MSHSLTWNGTAFSTYGLIVLLPTPAPSLSRSYDSIQAQDRAWAGKGQGNSAEFNLPVIIVGTSSSNLLTRVSTIRGLLDQEDECTLSFDMYTDRYWMAKFDSLNGDYTSPTTWKGTLRFSCQDRRAYATAASSQVEELTENVSASYGADILSVCFDSEDDYVYVGGGSGTGKVYKLSSIDLTKIAEGPAYGGTIWTICDGGDGYIYYGGDGGVGQYDMCKLLKSDMTTIVRGPDYGGVIRSSYAFGNHIYYGGDGGAGEYDICKLLKSDMTTIVRSVSYGGVIYAVTANATHVFAGGATTVRARRYLISDLSYVDQTDSCTNNVLALVTDATYLYIGLETGTVWRVTLADLTAETISADVGTNLNCICIDDDYIYVGGDDNYVFKFNIDFAASENYVGKSATYGDNINGIAIDKTNGWLYIGGTTINTVWKLDTGHMPLILSSDSIGSQVASAGRATCEKGDYVYTAGCWTASSAKVLKIRKSDGAVVAMSAVYGTIYAICADDDGYVYCAGELGADDKVWQLTAENLNFVDDGPAYGGAIRCLCCGESGYVYYGGDGGAGQYDMCKLDTSDMTTIVRGPDYGGVIYCCCCDSSTSGYIYYGGDGGAGQHDMCQLLKSDMATIVRGNDYASDIYGCDTDGTYIYYGGLGGAGAVVTKTDIATMVGDTDSAALGANILSVRADATYNYAATAAGVVWKLLNSDMTTIAQSYTFLDDVYSMDIDDGYIYAQSTTTADTEYNIDKIDKRVLYKRSDHEVTLTSDGTANTPLDIAIVSDADNYWKITIQNETTDQTLYWEGAQLDTEVLVIDGVVWYVDVEDTAAISGQTGDFIELKSGANTIVLENVTGEAIFNWNDRFA